MQMSSAKIPSQSFGGSPPPPPPSELAAAAPPKRPGGSAGTAATQPPVALHIATWAKFKTTKHEEARPPEETGLLNCIPYRR